ncbi:hypothetical protein BKA65DRAFT_514883 [Rhexocercosporidium sp. MPI-PUGE-AT-0058]|nr:hypothetical protein BKA65DRAFT_514883 [Rhexocercosporidium sp. MPI-PUGE-AT-0058]
MPTTLPVPSKGALRALRKLALGTSCTIALGAGLLTEDRRRRIHSAREVHDNAKRLKSSRKYHSAGTTSLEALEGQAQRYRDEAFWLPSNVLKSTTPLAPSRSSTTDPSEIGIPAKKEELTKPLGVPKYTPRQMNVTRIPLRNVPKTLGCRTSGIVENPKRQSHIFQLKIASEVTKLLEQDSPDIDGAAKLFFEASEEQLPVDEFGLAQELIDASAKLSKSCQRLSMFATSARILDIILSYGLIPEENFNAFQPLEIIKGLLSAKGITDYSLQEPELLQKACSIYLTKFKEKPKSMSQEMRSIGGKLCRATCLRGMFDLTLALFSRLENRRVGQLPIAVDCLIKATHGKGHHKKILRHFLRLYTQTSPDQVQFFQVTGLVIDSMLTLGRLDDAEQVLVAASQMAETGGLDTSTTWFLRVLGEDFRAHRDLVRLQGLFRRLQLLFQHTRHPQALYGVMIQYCIESREEELATSYYRELRESHDRHPNDLRIYGHFALGKAYRGDWDGVKQDFHEMKQAVPEDDGVYSAMFTPILKEFTKSHSVDEIEDFIQYFIVRFHLKTTAYIMNTMIDVYSKAHEVDAISRWVFYAAADGCAVNSKTFNTILRNCISIFQFTFEETYRLYCLVQDLGADLVSNDSLDILRGLAVSRSSNEDTRIERLQRLKRHDDPVQTSGGNEIYRAMTITSAEKNYIAVLKIYKGAERDHIRLQSKHLDLAVRASLQLHGEHVAEAVRLIRDAQENGIDVINAVASIFIHQMSDLYQHGSEIERLAELAERTISSFEANGLKVSQKGITHTASILQRRGRSRMAIDFWDSMSRRLNIPTSKFDLATLTTLMKAYIDLKDGTGIRWVINVLSTNKLPPDTQLKGALKEARKEAGKRLDRNSYSERVHEWWDVLDQAHEEVKEMRRQALLTKEQVTFKVIKIMETAIEDQARKERAGNLDGLREQGQQDDGMEGSRVPQAEGNWMDLDAESPPISKRLVGAFGG